MVAQRNLGIPWDRLERRLSQIDDREVRRHLVRVAGIAYEYHRREDPDSAPDPARVVAEKLDVEPEDVEIARGVQRKDISPSEVGRRRREANRRRKRRGG